jgi:hypothetical protein
LKRKTLPLDISDIGVCQIISFNLLVCAKNHETGFSIIL